MIGVRISAKPSFVMENRLHRLFLSRHALCIRSAITDPYMNLALEDYVLRNRTGSTLMIWQNRPCVVMGRNQNPWAESDVEQIGQAQLDLVRRHSGGGSVYHDLGNVNYTLFLPRSQFDRKLALKMILEGFRKAKIHALDTLFNDLILPCGRKVSGSAYRLTGSQCYHHGTMLINSNLHNMRLLHSPLASRISASRAVLSKKSKVANLQDIYPWMTCSTFTSLLQTQFFHWFGAGNTISATGSTIGTIGAIRQQTQQLRDWLWIYGQTPEFKFDGRTVANGCTPENTRFLPFIESSSFV